GSYNRLTVGAHSESLAGAIAREKAEVAELAVRVACGPGVSSGGGDLPNGDGPVGVELGGDEVLGEDFEAGEVAVLSGPMRRAGALVVAHLVDAGAAVLAGVIGALVDVLLAAIAFEALRARAGVVFVAVRLAAGSVLTLVIFAGARGLRLFGVGAALSAGAASRSAAGLPLVASGAPGGALLGGIEGPVLGGASREADAEEEGEESCRGSEHVVPRGGRCALRASGLDRWSERPRQGPSVAGLVQLPIAPWPEHLQGAWGEESMSRP